MPVVILSPQVRKKLNSLFDVLLEEGYFLDPANAAQYCNDIRAFIRMLPEQKHHITKNKRWGRYYAWLRANRRTSWYITFDKEEESELYYVRNIFNNHVKGYAYFIAKLK